MIPPVLPPTPRPVPLRGAALGVAAACGLLLLAPGVVARTADPILAASWRSSDVSVDGSLAEWPKLERVGEGPLVAVQHDDAMLSLAVATSDVLVRQQLATGLIVWIDPTARRAQTLGVRVEGLVRRALPGTTAEPTATEVASRRQMRNPLDAFDRLGPAKGQRRLVDRAADVGVSLASGVDDGTIVYELTLPMAVTTAHPHAVGAVPGSLIAIGFETPVDPRAPRRREALDNPTSSLPYVIDPYGGFYSWPTPADTDARRAPKDVVVKPMKLMWAVVRLAVRTGP